MLLSYYARFVSPLEKGTKIHTLRNRPKRMPKIGEVLHKYTGGYNDTRKLITREHTLKSYQDVFIHIKRTCPTLYAVLILVDGRALRAKEIDAFVVNDGFEDLQDYLRYETKNFKLDEVTYLDKILFHWTDFKY